MKSTTPWWHKYRRDKFKKRNYLAIEMIVRKSIADTFKEYLSTCSIGSVKEIRNPDNCMFERLCWFLVFCTALSTVCFFLHSTWSTTLTRPLIVTRESSTYPIKDIDFPAVALCNINRISRKATMDYARKTLQRLNLRNMTTFYLEKFYENMGRLIDYRYEEDLAMKATDPLPLQDYNIIHLMGDLAPNCTKMLIKCRWAGEEVNCSTIFKTRRTGLGHCCAFNYILDLNSADSPTGTIAPVKKQTVPGANNGLMVVIDPLRADYSYRLGGRSGLQVMVYDPRKFPDLSGGRVLYRIAQPDQAVFLQIDSIKQYATDEVRKYSHDTRKCLFRNELKDTFGNKYSYSACLIRCRIQTVHALCNCVPYFYPSSIYKDTDICTPRHLRCLNKYKEKLLYIFPKDAEHTEGLEAELADSLVCPDCLPDCELTQHFIRNYKVALKNIRNGFENNFLDGVNLTDKCVLSIYQPTGVGTLHRLDVVSYWYEILSNIGGFAGMMMGIGYFTFIEILYYSTIRFTRSIYINYKQ